MQEAYIVGGLRTPVGKAGRSLRFIRPDTLAKLVIDQLLKLFPQLDPARVDDIIVGCAVPEAEQGLQMGRLISLLSHLPIDVPGFIINRYCGSGLEAIALACYRIRSGDADCIIAGGAESMSLVPMTGWKFAPNPDLVAIDRDYFLNMGLTAEEVAKDFGITREDCDQWALRSHQRALHALQEGYFKTQTVPVPVEEKVWDPQKKQVVRHSFVLEQDEGPRPDTSLEKLAQLKPVFKKDGLVTAGNSSQRSDGAAFVLVMSEKMVKELGIEPWAVLRAYAVRGVHPRIMGIGPVEAVPRALQRAGLTLDQIDLIELNEAFAAQTLAVIRQLNMDPEKVNINGGAIALGHPLGCTGAKLTIQLLFDLQRLNKKYGIVTACVGGGQGVAGVFERVGTFQPQLQ